MMRGADQPRANWQRRTGIGVTCHPARWAIAAVTRISSPTGNACRYLRMLSRPATIEGVHSAEVWQPGEGKQALAYKRRVEWRSRYRDNRARRGGAPSGRPVTVVHRGCLHVFPIPCPITVITACHRAHQHAHSRRMSVHGHKSQFHLPSHCTRRSRDRQNGRRDLGPDGKPSRLDRAAARHFDQPDGGADPTPQQSGRGREVWSALSQRASGRRFCVHPPFRSRIGSFAPHCGRSGIARQSPQAVVRSTFSILLVGK